MAKSDAPKVAKEKKEKAPRAPSPYNKFMKDEIARVKKAQPGLDHKEAFKAAAANVSPPPPPPFFALQLASLCQGRGKREKKQCNASDLYALSLTDFSPSFSSSF